MALEMNHIGCLSQDSRLRHDRGNWGQRKALPQLIYKYFVFLYINEWGSPWTCSWTGAKA